ncbi:unnamed protein product, partial [Rotaria sordida]
TQSAVTTHLDSQSMATDDSDCYPTTSKFFKTQPSEFNSKQGESGEEISANYINILASPKLFETNVTFPMKN